MVKLNMLDRAISYVAPARAVKRVARRAMMEELQRSYTGADRGRFRGNWHTRATSADAEIAAGGQLLRDRMRDLVRNNTLAANAVALLVIHAVGDGIVPVFTDHKVKDAFERWAKGVNFFGVQALAVREMIEGGDGLVRPEWMKLGTAEVPLQLQVLEADQIDSRKDASFGGASRNAIQGVEVEKGRATGYWLFDDHPGSKLLGGMGALTSTLVPASEVAHVFERQRTQVRGVPWGTPAIGNLHDLEEYKVAERMRKRLEACLVGIMTGGEADDMIGLAAAPGQDPGIYDVHGHRVEKFAPGMFYNAVGGRDVKFTQPAATGDYPTYVQAEEHAIAAGFRMPHFILTGRLDQVNYSSSKVGIEVFKREISQLQWLSIIPMLCEPMIGWFLKAAYLAGAIDSPVASYTWVPPRFYSADPMKDLNAQKGEVRAGFKSWSAAVAERGEDPDATAQEIAKDNKRFDDLGLVLDIDGRVMSSAGQLQKVPQPANSNAKENEE
ncbi:phage portal protein [Devosia ginsengisoli]|uniref:phage portal protein n=1 Tax=Devosia ginsengisoli TaxID=400770 RepID=UPI0026F1FE62|nr:phage portal protein [Devosia ginsengisoli]MCR6672192.1 phage portal protein [Devosia ginsengisoli]